MAFSAARNSSSPWETVPVRMAIFQLSELSATAAVEIRESSMARAKTALSSFFMMISSLFHVCFLTGYPAHAARDAEMECIKYTTKNPKKANIKLFLPGFQKIVKSFAPQRKALYLGHFSNFQKTAEKHSVCKTIRSATSQAPPQNEPHAAIIHLFLHRCKRQR